MKLISLGCGELGYNMELPSLGWWGKNQVLEEDLRNKDKVQKNLQDAAQLWLPLLLDIYSCTLKSSLGDLESPSSPNPHGHPTLVESWLLPLAPHLPICVQNVSMLVLKLWGTNLDECLLSWQSKRMLSLSSFPSRFHLRLVIAWYFFPLGHNWIKVLVLGNWRRSSLDNVLSNRFECHWAWKEFIGHHLGSSLIKWWWNVYLE